MDPYALKISLIINYTHLGKIYLQYDNDEQWENVPLNVPLQLYWGKPRLLVHSDQADECVDFRIRDVLLQQFSVVVKQGGDGILRQHVVSDLLLHERKLFGNVLLQRQRIKMKGYHFDFPCNKQEIPDTFKL